MALQTKSEMKETSAVARELAIVVPGEMVAKELDKAYRALSGRVKMKGFRKGRVPRYVLEQYYKGDTEQQVLEKIVGDSYRDALAEHEIVPVAQPEIDTQSELIPGMDFAYSAKVEVKPEISLESTKGLAVEKITWTVDDAAIDMELDRLREQFVEVKPVEGRDTVQQGDLVECNWSGAIGETPVKGLSGVSQIIEIGANKFFTEAEQALVGKKLDEQFTVDVKVSDEHAVEAARGKDVTVTIKPTEIKERIVPELNDDFAQDIDDEFETLDMLKTKIRETLEEQAEARSKNDTQENTLKAFIEANPFEIPNSLVEQQAQRLAMDKLRQFPREQAEQLWERLGQNLVEDARSLATQQVRGGLLLEQLSKDEGIEVTDEEVDAKVAEQAESSGQPAKKLKNIYKKSGRLDELRHQISTEKALTFLLDNAKVDATEKKVSEANKESAE